MSNLFNVKQKENTGGRKLYTGIGNFKVVAVNPTLEKLKELLGTDNINEPNYTSAGKCRLDLWVKSTGAEGLLTKVTLWLEDAVRKAQSGNTLFINEKNQSTWSSDLQELAGKPSMAWFDLTTARECKVGEDSLYDFVVAYINADTSEGGIRLESIDNIIAGNVEELVKLFDHYNNQDRSIRLLVGVKDNRQVIYTKFFQRMESNSVKPFMNRLEQNAFNASYTLEGLKEFSLDNVAPQSTTATTETKTSNGLF